MSSKTRIAVIGAGVIGLATAFRLARNGHDVALIDRGEARIRASYGNAGHLATEQVFPLASPATLQAAPAMLSKKNSPLSIRSQYATQILPWLMRFTWASRPAGFRRGTAALASLQRGALDSMAALCTDADIAQLLHRRGHMIIVESENGIAAAREQQQRYAQHDVASSWLTPEQIAERAPQLTREVAGGMLLHDTGHVDNPNSVCEGLRSAFEAAGGRYIEADVATISQLEGGAMQLDWQGESLRAEKVIVSAGAWSRELAKQLGHDVPLDTERGYNVCADGWHGEFDVSIASLDRMTIMTPMDIGLRITGFVEFGGLELAPKPAILARLKQHLTELFPTCELPEMSEWLGFRPSFPDHLPMIGKSPKNSNVIFAFGHQHLGLTLAGVTADIVSALIDGDEPPIDIEPFRINRF